MHLYPLFLTSAISDLIYSIYSIHGGILIIFSPTSLHFLIAKLDNKLVDYAGQSDGYKVVTLSDGTDYGGSFRKLQSIDPMDIFPGKTEVEIRDFIKNADPNNFDDQLKIRLFKENAPKLKAALLPGLEELVEGIKNIPDDIAKKKYFTLGLKALGPIGTYIAADDTYEALKAGRPVAEALEYGLIGTNLIGSAKDLMALSPEEREARSVVKQDALKDLNLDMPMGFGFIEGPTSKTDMTLEQAQAKAAAGAERVKALEAEKNLQRSRSRGFGTPVMADEFLAGGGIAGLSGGIDKGPQRTSMNPDSEGLLSLKNRVRNY